MKLLDRYLLAEMLPPFLGACLTFVVLLVGHMLYTVVQVVVERAAPLPSVAEFVLLKVPGAAVLAIPVSALLAVSLAFNRLAADGELLAIRAGGAGLVRMLWPALLLGILAALAVLGLNEKLAPRCEKRSREVLLSALRRQRSLAFRPGHFLKLSDVAWAYPADVDPRRDRLLGVKVFLVRPNAPPILLSAPEAVFARDALIVPRSRILAPEWDGSLTWGPVGTMSISLKPEALYLPTGAEELRTTPMGELWKRAREQAQRAPRLPNRWALELHSRLAVAAAAIVFCLLGPPLVLHVGRGQSLAGVALSLVVVFFYYLGMLWTRLLGERGLLPPAAAAWLDNAVLLALALWLIWRHR